MALGSIRLCGTCLVALMVTACTSTDPRDVDPFSRQAATAVFAAGYRDIAEKYIETLSIGKLAFDGLKGLGALDPALSIARTGSDLTLSSSGVVIAQVAAPDERDAAGWAAATATLAVRGRAASPDLRGIDAEKIYEAVFDGALSHLDIFSRYAGADEATRNRANREGYGGVGIRYSVRDDGLRIIGIIEETPAATAGLRVGDHITHIDGQTTVGLDTEDVADRLRGPISSTVTLTIGRDGLSNALRFELARSYAIPDTVSTRFEGGIAFYRITGFNQNTDAALAAAIDRTRKARGDALKGIALDLRGNPGGTLKQAVRVADLFLADGTILTTRGRHPESLHDYSAATDDIAPGLPLVVLVDGRSASSAEIVAAALQDRRRAVVVGTSSYGKGTVQTVIRLPNGGEITLTWSRFITPSGYALHGLGVRPVICTSGAGGPGAATQIIAGALADRPKTADTITAWRRNRVDDDEGRKRLRASCPAERRFAMLEVEVAQTLLLDRALYTLALDLDPAPTTTASTEVSRP